MCNKTFRNYILSDLICGLCGGGMHKAIEFMFMTLNERLNWRHVYWRNRELYRKSNVKAYA